MIEPGYVLQFTLYAQAENGGEVIECNHGVQNGVYCECDDGWISSGVHQTDPRTFHWCDERTMSVTSDEPIKPSKPLEVFVVIVSCDVIASFSI